MAKSRVTPTKRVTSGVVGGDKPSAQDIKDEKNFFKVAIAVTLLVIALVYFIFN
jgi:hypothetical protein